MTHGPTPTCVADDEGRRCHRDATMTRPVALCHAHGIEVATAIVPELLREHLAAALRGGATAPTVRAELVATARAARVDDLLKGVHDSVVYFIANGGRVKIGYTTNLRSRLGSLALRSDAVLLALHGGPELERALHTHFADHRNGSTEWFELAPAIFRYIAAQHPQTVAARRNATAATRPRQRGHADPLFERARALGRPASLRTLQRELGIGQKRAQRLQQLTAED